MILPLILGHKVFEEIQQVKPKDTKEFIINSVRGANAKGHRTSEGFIVLKGSTISTELVNSFPDTYKPLRQELLNSKVIVNENGTLVFSKDHLFSSPSAAAIIVMGRSANGLTEWKLPDGTTLRDYDLK
ncbi:MAG: hypothetical protein PWR27_1240 [Petroclostridium sp.]|nr:hypothetical protein [Petroclostridium sp.]